jgi:hypothetical protein
MPSNHMIRKAARRRMAETGESYSTARRKVVRAYQAAQIRNDMAASEPAVTTDLTRLAEPWVSEAAILKAADLAGLGKPWADAAGLTGKQWADAETAILKATDLAGLGKPWADTAGLAGLGKPWADTAGLAGLGKPWADAAGLTGKQWADAAARAIGITDLAGLGKPWADAKTPLFEDGLGAAVQAADAVFQVRGMPEADGPDRRRLTDDSAF